MITKVHTHAEYVKADNDHGNANRTIRMKNGKVAVADIVVRIVLIWGPADLVRFLFEQNGQSAKDVVKLLGGKSHVPKVLSGARKIGPSVR